MRFAVKRTHPRRLWRSPNHTSLLSYHSNSYEVHPPDTHKHKHSYIQLIFSSFDANKLFPSALPTFPKVIANWSRFFFCLGCKKLSKTWNDFILMINLHYKKVWVKTDRMISDQDYSGSVRKEARLRGSAEWTCKMIYPTTATKCMMPIPLLPPTVRAAIMVTLRL